MKQIKVEHTRMHRINVKPQFGYGAKIDEIPVVEGKLVLINERDKPLFYVNNINPHFPKGYVNANFYTTERHPNDKRGIDRRIGDSTGRKIGLEGNNDYWLGKIPIIISETERIIRKDEWIYDENLKELYQARVNGNLLKYCYKVLVLPEQFSPKHLQAIVDGKMKNGDKVLLECEDTYTEWKDAYSLEGNKMRKRPTSYPIKTIKLNSFGHVTLHKVEKPVVEYEASLGVGNGDGQHFVHGNYDTIKLLQEKLLKMEKMYTKAEVRKLTKDAWVQGHYNPTTPEFEDWFEQNVK